MKKYVIQMSNVNKGRLPYPIILNEEGRRIDNQWNEIECVLGVSEIPEAGWIDIYFDELRKDVKAAKGRYLVVVGNGGIHTLQAAVSKMRKV
jgi:hypothetical protein|nr:MAG TPA: hypothetical protein [Caudoviricetes sp.]